MQNLFILFLCFLYFIFLLKFKGQKSQEKKIRKKEEKEKEKFEILKGKFRREGEKERESEWRVLCRHQARYDCDLSRSIVSRDRPTVWATVQQTSDKSRPESDKNAQFSKLFVRSRFRIFLCCSRVTK